ncbi:MAG: NAD-dependent epimerase/dehydratase family protein, partial [candidate division Zixibacteria bacterium]|nr:NAD-dependent epimerase/dehydratase family protein [candidate division Zixibacteria bacterium]
MTEKEQTTVVAVSGQTGLIGSALCESLLLEGYKVRRLVRSAENLAEDEIPWSVGGGLLDPARMSGVDCVVHLAGESLMGYWTRAKKRRIRDSRVIGVENLSKSLAELAALDNSPKALL